LRVASPPDRDKLLKTFIIRRRTLLVWIRRENVGYNLLRTNAQWRGEMYRTLSCLFATVALTACTAVSVKPVNQTEHAISHVCIQENPKVIVAGFVESIESGLSRHGISSERYTGDKPPDRCVYTLTYVARQNWDVATYLWLAKVELRKGAELVGTADYHLRNKGGLSLNKWASVEAKMAPVMDQLLTSFPRTSVQ